MSTEWLATVDSLADPLPGARLLYLHCVDLAALCRPGQFVMVQCGDGYDPYLRFGLPIHRLAAEGLGLLFRPAGPGLRWLGSRRVGDPVHLLGPFGRGFTLPRASSSPDGDRAITLVAEGLGLGPLLSLLDRATGPVRLVVAAATPDQVYPNTLLPPHVEYLRCVGWAEQDAFWHAVRESITWGHRLYAGGATTLWHDLRRLFEASPLGLRPGTAEVWVETELGCGLGRCGGCLVPTRRGLRYACQEGPAFDLTDLL